MSSLLHMASAARPRALQGDAPARRGRTVGWMLAIAFLAGAGWLFLDRLPRPVPRRDDPLTHAAYVWQRAWTAPVQQAIAAHAPDFEQLVLLGAEVTFTRGHPQVMRVDLPWHLLRQQSTPLALAIRIASYNGPFRTDDPVAARLVALAADLLADARAHGVRVNELQIDFDAAESRLAGYRTWLAALRRAHPPALTITALPAWLDRAEFAALVRATDGYVLQVHSFSRPQRMDQVFPLCDPSSAWRAVERAGTFGVPFRVALPTYGYDAVFSADGRFIRALAETAPPPPSLPVRRIAADPSAMARLVRQWTHDRPLACRGIIWYRLPTRQDRINWHWATLQTVMRGHTPQARLDVVVSHPSPGLVELQLRNRGSADAPLDGRLRVRVDCRTDQLRAGDNFSPFAFVDRDAGGVTFSVARPAPPLAPHSAQAIGWLRFAQDTEVHAHVAYPD